MKAVITLACLASALAFAPSSSRRQSIQMKAGKHILVFFFVNYIIIFFRVLIRVLKYYPMIIRDAFI